MKMSDDPRITDDEAIDNFVASLRKEQLITTYKQYEEKGKITGNYKKGFFEGYAEAAEDLQCEFKLLYEYVDDKNDGLYRAMLRDFKRFQIEKEIEVSWKEWLKRRK